MPIAVDGERVETRACERSRTRNGAGRKPT